MLTSYSNLSAQSKEFITIAGRITAYNSNTGYACFFVDQEMVDAGVTIGLGNQSGTKCTSPEYGKGIPINLNGLPLEGDYTTPPSDETVLVSVKGRFRNVGKAYELQATQLEPFF